MYNFLKVLFGVPSSDQQGSRMDGDLANDSRGNLLKTRDDFDGDDDLRENPEAHITRFGFPIFNDAVEIHKYFESLIDEMHRKFEKFGFHNGQNFTWEEDQGGPSLFSDQQVPRQSESLRDSFLKHPGYVSDRSGRKEDIDLDGRVKADDLDQFLGSGPDTSNESNSIVQIFSPKIYSKSVFIRKVKRPDGSVEIIKKVRDHTGNEETTITHEKGEDPNLPLQGGPLIPNDDIPGISILKHFFSF